MGNKKATKAHRVGQPQIQHWVTQRKQLGHLLVALDFDGTIAPIVKKPDEAAMLPTARTAIEQLLKRADTDIAIVSGRALGDLRERCALDGVYYSGNHGLEIEGPGVHETRTEALRLQPRIQEIARELERRLHGIEGVFFEDKQLTLSVHTRMIDDEDERASVHAIVEATVNRNAEGLRLTYGKRVIEVRPAVDWHKGEATLFLVDCVEKAQHSRVFPIFVGDDVTDEDAFVALAGRGAGILVASQARPTAAEAYVGAPEDVVSLLEALAE